MNITPLQLLAVIGMLKDDDLSKLYILEYIERCLKWNFEHEKKAKKK